LAFGVVYKVQVVRYEPRMAVVHISEAEAARDFGEVMARVRAGERVIIEADHAAVAVVEPAARIEVRRLSESLRLARERGHETALDAGFGRDVEGAVSGHVETFTTTWE
jgi:antitoxin (DNA-binding transcriptional repressor) of toxin-antitoxin stability system